MAETYNFTASHLHAVTRQIFMAAGAPRHIANCVAGVLVNANLSGHDSHGVLRIPQYLGWIADGSLQPAAEPIVVKEAPNSLLVNGGRGFGHYAALQTVHKAIKKAKSGNVACANLVHMSHIGRLGEYAEAAALAGCIGIITCGVGLGCTTPTRVVPFGGAVGKLDTNAIAIGVPTGSEAPFIADFATSVVAEGKVRVALSKNLDLAEGCILDKYGNATVKPSDFFDGGWLLPLGGHKG
ncbi:MAG: Ldh family oxidoreductase, partial [Candidatus Poribacteria bacterium]|nr:Ldh family oxidoreductase [Candidatus Poribacteria bacterium]